MLGGDLTQPGLVPGEELAADAASAVLRVEEADLLVDARAVRLVVPEDAAVRDRKAVDLRDQEVTRWLAALHVVVTGGDFLGGLHPVVSFALRTRGDDAREVRIVVPATERPEAEAFELRTCCHCWSPFSR